MGANFGAATILKRRDDLAARRIVFGIRGEDEEHVERQPQRVALNLNVAFLHNIEEANLDFAGKIGEFVDGENAAIGAGQQTVVNGEFVGKVAATASGADRVHVANDVGDGHVRGGQFF